MAKELTHDEIRKLIFKSEAHTKAFIDAVRRKGPACELAMVNGLLSNLSESDETYQDMKAYQARLEAQIAQGLGK